MFQFIFKFDEEIVYEKQFSAQLNFPSLSWDIFWALRNNLTDTHFLL